MSFVSDMAAKVKAQQQQQRQKDEAFVERRKLIRARAPAAWQQIRDWFERTCGEFNREVGSQLLAIQPTASTELIVRYAPEGITAADLHLSFREESGEVRFHNSRRHINESLAFQLSGETLTLSGLGTGGSIEQTCEEMLAGLIS